MIGIIGIVIFDAKIIHTEAKCDGSSVVSPQTYCVGDWFVTMGFKIVNEIIICENGGLFEAVHSFGYFDMYLVRW